MHIATTVDLLSLLDLDFLWISDEEQLLPTGNSLAFFPLLSIFAILASHMFAYQICRHTQAIKITFWKHFLSSLAAHMMLTWQHLTVSSLHRRATHDNRSRDSELMSKMTTFVGKHTDVFVGLAASQLKGKVLLEKSGFLLCSTH